MRCVSSPFALSISVIAVAAPPSAETLKIGAVDWGVKRIVPSRFHVPPLGSGASQIVKTAPPSASIFLSFPLAKKPMERLSGDQKGREAPSVPARRAASVALRDRR